MEVVLIKNDGNALNRHQSVDKAPYKKANDAMSCQYYVTILFFDKTFLQIYMNRIDVDFTFIDFTLAFLGIQRNKFF